MPTFRLECCNRLSGQNYVIEREARDKRDAMDTAVADGHMVGSVAQIIDRVLERAEVPPSSPPALTSSDLRFIMTDPEVLKIWERRMSRAVWNGVVLGLLAFCLIVAVVGACIVPGLNDILFRRH